ncbi:MAG: MOSC domain-containing protein [bacterium]
MVRFREQAGAFMLCLRNKRRSGTTMGNEKDTRNDGNAPSADEGPLRGTVVGVAVGERRGAGKTQVPFIDLQEGHGVLGDGHAGTEKQVSLAATEDIEHMNRTHGLHAGVGDFAENIATRGIDLMTLSPGDDLRVGPALLRVVRKGKTPEEMKDHAFSFKGHVLLPTRGLFCRVVKGGRVRAGDTVSVVGKSQHFPPAGERNEDNTTEP